MRGYLCKWLTTDRKKFVYDYLKPREIQMTNSLRINKIALRSRVEGYKIN